jgi:hypothetical protein
MATYDQIETYVNDQFGFKPKSCWIAHVKEMSGLLVRRAWNRTSAKRRVPCPPDRSEPIKEALRYFGML